MAERRMFAKSVIDSDLFLDMPATTQMLYFHLAMRADDDGFISNPKRIMRMIGSSDDDMRILIAKQFIIPFESGIVVIRHWKVHNYIRSDRYKPSVCKEKKNLCLGGNLVYQLDTAGQPSGIPDDTQQGDELDTQDRVRDRVRDRDKYILSDSGEEDNSEGEKNSAIYSEIIVYLNEQAETNYSPRSKTNQRYIHARLAEGYTVDDFKKVIDNKCADWKGTEWEKYLRPATLFGTKFESYLNQKQKKKETNGIPIAKNREPDILDAIL